MDPELWELLEEGNSDDEVAAIIRLSRPGIFPPGVQVITQFGEIITVRMIRGSIIHIRESEEVDSFKSFGPPFGPEVELDDTELLEGLDDSIRTSDERRTPSLDSTGRGVVVGIVDWSLDFCNYDFRNPDGSTRVLALWDQRGKPRPESPQPYGYGIVHTREAINQALTADDPYVALGYHPADADLGRGSHGTLVASIAVGNGRGGGPVGIAPEAEIVFVHNATWGQDPSAKLGNSVTLLEAIDFIAQTAGERPWVINLSMGRTGEQHDGTTLVEQGLDAVLRAAPGRAICQSTGNYFTRRLHASGQLRPAEERTLIWEVMKADVTPNELEIWYPGRDKMEVEIRSPNGETLAWLKLGERAPLIMNGQTVGRAYHRESEPNNLANHIDIFLYAEAPAGAWEVMLIATDVVDGRFHAWIERDAACPNCQSHFRQQDADPTSTTGTICNGLRTIAVGAYDPHHPDQPVASFSSMGPTRDGRLKPDLCAPGVGILGARSTPHDKSDETPPLTRMSGTSFAAPHVTGCIALMLQVAPRPLRIEEIHNLLLANTRKVNFPEEIPGRTGGGYLDIERAVEAAKQVTSVGPKLKMITTSQEATMMREEPGMEIIDLGEGRVEEVEAEEESSWQNTYHRIANDITSAFEGGKPGTLNLYDRGIISYGKHQATLASGTLYPILKRYTELSSSETARKMSAYLERVKQKDETLREDQDFIQLLKDAAREPEMNRAQDEEFTRQYWEPSKQSAREAGIKSALGYAILYDTRVQGGVQKVLKKTMELLGGKIGNTVGGKEITEQEFLRVFVEERIQRNLRISANQKSQAEELSKEADALEEEAAMAADPELAKRLRLQAANKRNMAKQNAANAAALQMSANKTRGPSLRTLVDSGDLNLYGDAEGKIYLKGKSGVAINGLKPGAMIDSTTSAEQVEEEAAEEAVSKHNFVLISGGPGPYDNRDVEHDQSWANYVTPPLLLTDSEAKRKTFSEENEKVWWFVYKPAYERRWAEDSSSSNAARKKAVKNVKDQGFSSYTDLIEARASTRGWNLRWLLDAAELWNKLKTFSKNSISRVYYWGHARDDLWLSVQHDADIGRAIAPNSSEIIEISSIDSKLKNRFRKGDVEQMNRFIGCNTANFAEAWSKAFVVWSEGVNGKVNFASIHKTGGEPCLVDGAQVKYFSPGGKDEPGEAWRAKAVECATISFESLPEEVEALEAVAGQKVPLKVGEIYEVVVKGAPSTGHQWQVILPPEAAGVINLVEVVNESVTQPQPSSPAIIKLGGMEFPTALLPTEPIIGGTIIQRFRFRALAPGEVNLSLIYRPPIKLNVAEERSFSFRINPATRGQEEALVQEALQAPETEMVELVELVDQAISEGSISHSPSAVLHDMLLRAGPTEALTTPGTRRLPSVRELFEAFAYPGRDVLREQLEQHFEAVTLPRAALDGKLRSGDMMIRQGEGGLAHLAVIASPELWSYSELLSEGLLPESFNPGKYAQVVETGVRPHTLSEAFARSVVDAEGRLPYNQLIVRPREHLLQRIGENWIESKEEETTYPQQDAEFDWEFFESEQNPSIPSHIAEFAVTLGKEWAQRRNGSPTAEKITEWLLQDYQDTLVGAHLRWSNKLSDDSIGRAWMISRQEQMNFQTSSAAVRPLRNFQPPTESVALVSNTSLIEDSDKAPVAPIIIRFVQELHQHYQGSLHVSTYRGHGGGNFKDRGYSVDLFLQGRDDRGFFLPQEAVKFLRVLHDTAKATDTEWRVIYNDFSVADAINRETGQAHVIFVGTASRDSNKQATGLIWHGPHPLILHFHLDLVPLVSVAHERVRVLSGHPDPLRSGPTSGERTESVAGSCPDVPVPASQRPEVLVRGSDHSAVREAQRKLNAFHAYRIAAGLPGLRDAPLIEDCSFRRHTFEAVKSFQELVFPGKTIEHDGKIGSHTWAQLDALAVGTGPIPAAQLTVEKLQITNDGFSSALSWNQVIGLDTTTLNLELIASGLPPATMPAQIRVELSSRIPNQVSGNATLGAPILLDVPRAGSDPINTNRIIYRISRSLADVGDFLKVERSLKEVATIVRSGGTSDAEFRRALGWNLRGVAIQPSTVGISTGSEASEIPDALSLFRSAGVEVLEVRVPTQPNWRVPSAIKRLVRSPADVVYYSGHGLSTSGKLAIDIENKPCGEHGTYSDWLGPLDLIPVWTKPMDLDILILAGCSVLKIDFSTSPPRGPGLEWAKLLAAKGGPLTALLGYQRGAPCDAPNGDKIAREMASRLSRGSVNFAQDWLLVNGDNNANKAVSLDARGYWWIEGTLLGGYDIKGPKSIP